MKLRPFAPADRAEFLAMCADFYSGPAAAAPIPRSRMEATFDALVADTPYGFGFILEQDGFPAGYALVYPFYSNEAGGLCLMLDEIYVKPAWRNRRLGGDYLREIAPEMEKRLGRPIAGLKLECCPANEGAQRLYKAHGFHPLPYTVEVQGWNKTDN